MRPVSAIPRLQNVPVLVRAALNVPIQSGVVAGSFRLRRALPTIDCLSKLGARVILLGHIGDQGTETLLPVHQAMRAWYPRMEFCPVTIGKEAREAVRQLPAGGILMLENVRRHRGEKLNDESFARELAQLADVFVQDSFDVCHRAHASVVGVPRFLPSYAGLLVEEEVRELRVALKPKNPSLAIIGGAKFATKEAVLRRLLKSYSHVFVGGALANDFMAEQGIPVGLSLRSKEGLAEIRALLSHKRLLLPRDTVVAVPGTAQDDARTVAPGGLYAQEAILDDGPETVAMLKAYGAKAKTILWNGPLGNYENGFTEGTEALSRALADAKAHTIVGGGDTVAAIEKLGLNDRFSFVSTGGGAMLEYLAEGTLPGIEALS